MEYNTILSREEMSEIELNELAERLEKGFQYEKDYLSKAMDPAFDDDEREGYLDSAYLEHLKRNMDCRCIGKEKYDAHLKRVVKVDYEKLFVKEFEDYCKGEDVPEQE